MTAGTFPHRYGADGSSTADEVPRRGAAGGAPLRPASPEMDYLQPSPQASMSFGSGRPPWEGSNGSAAIGSSTAGKAAPAWDGGGAGVVWSGLGAGSPGTEVSRTLFGGAARGGPAAPPLCDGCTELERLREVAAPMVRTFGLQPGAPRDHT